MAQLSVHQQQDSPPLDSTDGRAKFVVIAAVMVGLLLAFGAGAIFFMAGDEEAEESADEVSQEGFDQPYVGSDDDEVVEEPSASDDEVLDEALAGDDEADRDSKEASDRRFQEFSREEIAGVFKETLKDYGPDEYDEAIDSLEREMRRDLNALSPERRREVALNHDQAMMEELILEALSVAHPEGYEQARSVIENRNQ